jgi:hypothetical protein
LECKISADRFKHLDYAAHAYAIAAYNGSKDIKAPDLRNMISEFGSDRGGEVLELSASVDDALAVLAEVNKALDYTITQKWIFVDLVWIIMQNQGAGKIINVKDFASRYRNFEILRRAYNTLPGALLLRGSHPDIEDGLSQNLYNFIGAFKVQAGLRGNLVLRNKSLKEFF